MPTFNIAFLYNFHNIFIERKNMKYFNFIILSIGLLFTSISAQDLITQEIDRLEEVFIKEAVKTNAKMLAISAGSIIIGIHKLSNVSGWNPDGTLSGGDAEKLFSGLGFIAAGVLAPPLASIKTKNVSSAEIAVRNEAKEFARKNAGFGIKARAKKVARPIATEVLTNF